VSPRMCPGVDRRERWKNDCGSWKLDLRALGYSPPVFRSSTPSLRGAEGSGDSQRPDIGGENVDSNSSDRLDRKALHAIGSLLNDVRQLVRQHPPALIRFRSVLSGVENNIVSNGEGPRPDGAGGIGRRWAVCTRTALKSRPKRGSKNARVDSVRGERPSREAICCSAWPGTSAAASALRLVRRSSASLRRRLWIGLSGESGRSHEGPRASAWKRQWRNWLRICGAGAAISVSAKRPRC